MSAAKSHKLLQVIARDGLNICVVNRIPPCDVPLVPTLLIKIMFEIQVSYQSFAVLAHDANKKVPNVGQAHGMTQSTLGDWSTGMGNKDVGEVIRVPRPMQPVEQIIFVSSGRLKVLPIRAEVESEDG